MRDAFTIITDDDLHASLARVRSIGSPISFVSRRCDTEGSGSGEAPSPPPNAGAAVRPFNLNACFKMGEGR